MTEIIPNLYLLSWSETQDKFKELPNAYIVNCTKNLPFLTDNSIRIEVDDDGNKENIDNMFMYYISVIDIIDEKLKANTPVFVHCLAGMQRSPSVIAAYLMSKKGYTLVESILEIRNKRKESFFWQVNFKDSLERFYSFIKN